MGKPSPPPPPNYTPFLQAAQTQAASDAQAAQIQAQVAEDQLAQQSKYAEESAAQGQQYADMAQQQQEWGQQQYENIQPYLTAYMQAQLDWQGAAQTNEEQQTAIAAQNQQDAQQTYDRYMSTYAPLEDQFAATAAGWDTQAREDQQAAAAMGDVGTAFSAQKDAA